MKTVFSSVAFCFIVSMSFSQFQHSFGTAKTELGKSLTQLHEVEKGYLVAGYTSRGYIGNLDATLVKTNLAGNQVWSHVYGGQDYEFFNSVRQSTYFSPNNPVAYVAAGITRSYGHGGGDAYMQGVDVNGTPVFSTVYGGKEYDVAHCIQNNRDVTGEPGYIFVGETNSYANSLPGTNVYVVKTDLFGNLKAATVIGNEGNQRGLWIEQTKDGGYIVSGSTTNYWCGVNTTIAHPPTDIFVIKLKPDLSVEWDRVFGYPEQLNPTVGYRNEATCVKQNNQGNYVLTGYTNSFGINDSYDVFMLYLDGNGGLLGLKTYGTKATEQGYGLEETVDSAGNSSYTIVGHQKTTSYKAIMLQVNSWGVPTWAFKYGDNKDESGLEIVKDVYDRGYAFTGYTTSLGAGDRDIYLVETTATGKTNTFCQKEMQLEVKKHQPCIAKIAKQFFVKDYKKIEVKDKKIEYKQSRCNPIFDANTEKTKSIEESSIALFPNPVSNLLTIENKNKAMIIKVEVFDIQGTMVLAKNDVGKKRKIELSTETLSQGTYVVKLSTKKGDTQIIKFVKK
ncbi:T9SS type A sorting domain-containing protein [Aquimarina aquimarini]|uniref:T9SS type A sorting domain-containing protein n=1 Tax=Aquimarina aquimarini TaxID=1191734 RepID=UPI000D55015C|nr:T9SS type A sorting domain-containing protein [Aquimarina aquimarini]